MNLLNLISTCHFLSHTIDLKRNWPRFSLPKFCRSGIYVITIVKFSNRPIQILFNFPQQTSMIWFIKFILQRMQLTHNSHKIIQNIEDPTFTVAVFLILNLFASLARLNVCNSSVLVTNVSIRTKNYWSWAFHCALNSNLTCYYPPGN